MTNATEQNLNSSAQKKETDTHQSGKRVRRMENNC